MYQTYIFEKNIRRSDSAFFVPVFIRGSLVSLFFLFFASAQLFSLTNINNANLFISPSYNNEGDIIFSSLNPNYSGYDRDERYIFNAVKEVAKYISIDLAYRSTAYPMGSFNINNSRIFVDYNTDMIEDILKYVNVILPVETNYGVVSGVRISRGNLAELWGKNNKTIPPDYSEVIKIIDSFNKHWYYDLPAMDGYIFGLGISDTMSTVEKKVEMADFNSMIDIINILHIKVSNEIFTYRSRHLSLQHLFSNQASSGYVSGIKVIKRYYSEEYKCAFSLSVLKLR